MPPRNSSRPNAPTLNWLKAMHAAPNAPSTRKAFLAASLAVHPDKHNRSVRNHQTEMQKLVGAYWDALKPWYLRGGGGRKPPPGGRQPAVQQPRPEYRRPRAQPYTPRPRARRPAGPRRPGPRKPPAAPKPTGQHDSKGRPIFLGPRGGVFAKAGNKKFWLRW